MQLTSLGKVTRLRHLFQSPFTLHKQMMALIEREIAHAQNGRPARIILKMNALVEPLAVQALYRASRAGVQVDCVVRGMCALRPGVPGVSERIRVRSIVGRFLEHTRVFYFHNDGDPDVFLSSADFMERNFFQRIEVAFPLETKKSRERVIRELKYYLRDNCQAWELRSDGSYERPDAGTSKAFSAQQRLLEEFSEYS